MKKVFYFFIDKIWILVAVYVIIQIIYLVTYNFTYTSDSHYYLRLARESIQQKSFYPAPIHLYEDFISAPLYINILMIVLSIYNSTISIGILNIILNFIQLFLLYKITLHLFNPEAAKISVLLYIFYLNTLGLVLLNLTEFLFTVLVLLSIYFYLRGDKKYFFIAGLSTAATISIRPAGFTLLAAFLILFFIYFFKKNIIYKEYASYFAGFLLFIFSFGFFTQSYFGKFIYTSTNGPGNLLIGANDYSTGGFKDKIFKEGEAAFIENPEAKTYIEKGNFWDSIAVNWIRQNPFKWLSYIPPKLFHTFAWDDVSISFLTYSEDWNLYKTIKYIAVNKSLNGLFKGKPLIYKVFFISIQFFHHLYYFILIILIGSGILLAFRRDENRKAVFLICSFIFFNILMHMIVFGSPRFKYPYIIASLPYSAYYLQYLFRKRK